MTNPTTLSASEPRRDCADLVVWDSTPAGLISAITAARSGLSVLVVTEDLHVGGLQTSGLGFTNAGQRETVGGLAREFHDRIRTYYSTTYGEHSTQFDACSDGFFFEPHVAEFVYREWLAEAGVRIAAGEVLTTVNRSGAIITGINCHSGSVYEGKIFIDASYEGDLIAASGCSFRLGREARSEFDEQYAGSTYPPATIGSPDHKLQPFDFRCCLTNDNQNRIPFREPKNYNPEAYAWQRYRMKKSGSSLQFGNILPLNMMPNSKTDSRVAEWPGHSWEYIEADRMQRQCVEQAHRKHSEGYLWFVMTDPSVPKEFREQAASWGLAADEFVDNENWPYHIYVREGRRLRGEFVMTEKDVLRDLRKSDSVGICSWYLDVHPVELFVEDGVYHEEGTIYAPVRPYEISYRALLPKRDEAANLMAPVALSASHVAFASLRVEPVWMVLGHACGVAASMALEDKIPLHQLPVKQLQKRLLEQGQILDSRPFKDYWP